MRVHAIMALVIFLALYAYRDWFKALCGLILLIAVVEHPDMPKTIMGIQGLNPWNLVLVNVLASWWLSFKREGLEWDMPPFFNRALLVYLAVVLFGFFRVVMNLDDLNSHQVESDEFEPFTMADLVSERLINTVKWVIPGLLLFMGARSRPRVLMGLFSILGVYVLLALQVIRWMPMEALHGGAELEKLSRKFISNEIGFHRVNMSMMLAGAAWAILSTLALMRNHWSRAGIILTMMMVSWGQALTGGRMGYVTWGVIGLTMSLMRWRKYLILIPFVVVTVVAVAPGVVERFTTGFGAQDLSGGKFTNDYEITAGRTLIWPAVIDKIGERPFIGWGRLGMHQTGLVARLWNEQREAFPHPHNAYLEWALDNGMLGVLLIIPFWFFVLRTAVRMFLVRDDSTTTAVGGVALALMLALFVAAMGSQTFYPREGSVGMWAAIGLLMRVAVQRDRVFSHAQPERYEPHPMPSFRS